MCKKSDGKTINFNNATYNFGVVVKLMNPVMTYDPFLLPHSVVVRFGAELKEAYSFSCMCETFTLFERLN